MIPKSHDGIALPQYSCSRPSPYQSSISGSTIDLTVAGSFCRPSRIRSSSIRGYPSPNGSALRQFDYRLTYLYPSPVGTLSLSVELDPYVSNRPIGRWLVYTSPLRLTAQLFAPSAEALAPSVESPFPSLCCIPSFHSLLSFLSFCSSGLKLLAVVPVVQSSLFQSFL